MTHNSPAVYLVWSILVVTLSAFLIHHLWRFDRFRCLAWNSTGGNGTFKRIMTYTYLTSVPLLTVYAVGFCYIKYSEGYVALPPTGMVIPKPVEMWSQTHRGYVFPLQLCFSFAWSLEIVTHLEELCFWLFLIHTTDGSPWFRSPHFILWVIGSCIALVGLPSVTIYLKDDIELCEAWTFLTGSVGSLVLTVLFCPILVMFPNFLRKIRREGVEPSVMVRLAQSHNLNITRVVCRFFFVAPLLITAADAVRDTHVILISPFASDLLAMVGGFGCVTSSMITLMIFFPRSYEREAGYRYRERPMTELWSDDDDETQVTGGMYDSYKRTMASRMDMPDRDPYAYYESTPSPQRSDAHPAPRPAFDPQDHSYDPQGPTAPRSPPLPPPEKGTARRSRAPVWEMVSTNQDEPQEYYVGGRGGAVIRRGAVAGVPDSSSSPTKSNLHPILQKFSSPINVFDVQHNSTMGV